MSTAVTHVPFVDLSPASDAVRERLLQRVSDLLDRGDFINGAAVVEFEEAFAEYCGVRRCVGMSSGLDALRLGLTATGLEAGAGVVVPAATFAATFEAVLQAGGKIVVVDVGDEDYALGAATLDALSTEGCSHLVPVHLYGQLADMDGVARFADARRLTVLEDACQAHGAKRDGIRAGERSRAAAFSFYPAKNLGAMGDAGALVTDDEDVAELVRALRSHGETSKYHHVYVGYTARLDTVQAAVLVEKLPLLDDWNDARRAAARYYTRELAGLDGVKLPQVPAGSDPVWHLYVVRVADPAGLAAFLAERSIQTGRHYPEPPHLSPAYRRLGYARGDFPVAEALAREGLSLPLYPGISESQLEWVCRSIGDYAAKLT
jgi:dTDP-4-amino-4,6-dideoxygalactose transaminase